MIVKDRKKFRPVLILFLIAILQIGTLSPVLVTYADNSMSSTGQDVTGKAIFNLVDLKEDAGNNSIGGSLLGNTDLDKDIRFGLYFDFEFPVEVELFEGDYMYIPVPEQISLDAGRVQDLKDDTGVIIAQATYLDSERAIKVVFTDEVDGFYGFFGDFWFFGGFDESKFGNDNPEVINFSAIGKIINVHINKDDNTPTPTPTPTVTPTPTPAPNPPTIVKSGQQGTGANWNSFNWEITVDSKNVLIDSWTITDVIPAEQELVGNVTVIEKSSGDDITDQLTIDQNGVTINFDSYSPEIEGQYVVSFQTKLTEAALEAELSKSNVPNNIQVKNKATLDYNNEPTITSNEVTLNVPVRLLSKAKIGNVSGTINHEQEFEWKITVNESKFPLKGVQVVDVLDDDMEFIPGSILVNGTAPAQAPNFSDNQFTLELGDISDTVEITYKTKVIPEFFKRNQSEYLQNRATLYWNNGPSAGVPVGTGVNITSNVIAKSGAYNAKTGHITWTVKVNSNEILLTSPTVIDVIKETQEYVAGTYKVQQNGSPAVSIDDSDVYDGTDTLTYAFPSDITDTYTITFETLVLDPEHRTTNSSTTYYNDVEIRSTTLVNGKQTRGANTPVISKILAKSGSGYDYKERLITWTIELNQNEMPLANVVITDDIVKGLEFVNTSVKVNGADANEADYEFVAAPQSDQNYAGTFTYTFPNQINGKQIITFQTKVVDLNRFAGQNNDFSVGNTAILSHVDIVNGETVKETESGNQSIENNIVSKRANYVNGNDYIEWIVDINSNAVDLNSWLDVESFSLIDTLSPGLELDTTSVKLIKYATVNSNGQPQNPDEVELTKDNIIYDAATNQFQFVFPQGAIDSHAYQLRFITDVTAVGNYSNSISLNGQAELYDASSQATYVSFNAQGGSAGRQAGKVTIQKENMNGTLLADAKFELIDVFGNVVKTGTSDSSGQVVFKGVAFNKAYSIKEVEAPSGYVISGTVTDGTTGEELEVVDHTVAVNLTVASPNKTFVFANEAVNATVQFIKQGETNNPLQGAEFGLYPRGELTPIATAISNNAGLVSFPNVAYGQYDIREIKAPNGYVTSTDIVHQVNITADDHGKDKSYDAVTNELVKANIKFVKVNSSGTGIAGAEFSLYDSAGEFVVSAVSKSDGTVEFGNILAGQYTIQETEAPFGYVPLTGVVKSVEITEDDHGTTKDLGEVTNVLIEAAITFTKVDDNNNELPGASFGLYDSSDTLVQTEISEVDGTVTFTKVGQGSYTVKEIAAPTGYLPSTATQNVTITSADNGSTKQLNEFVNTRIKADVRFVKQDEDSNGLAGAEFGLYPRGAAAGSTPIDTATSNSSGVVLFENVEFGQYDIREIAAPAGYLTLEGVVRQVEVTADDHGETLLLTPVTNQLIRANIEFDKLDDADHVLAGAQFTLYNSSNTAVSTVESDENGLVQFTNILAGDYTIRETKAPFGYVPITGVIASVTITEAEHGTTIQLDEVTNVFIQSSIEFVKNNENNQPLAGATFGLYDSEDELVQSQTSQSGDGKVTFTNIGEGSYSVKEISPPYGYLPISGVIYNVTVSAEDHNETIELNPVANTLIEANIEYVKLNDKGQPLAGAEFVLLDDNEDVVQTVVSAADGKVTFVDVREGEYIIREKTAPVGYNPLTSDVAAVEITAAEHATTVTLSNVTNYIIKGDVEFVKVAKNSDRPLRNATFALYAAADTAFDLEIATATSNESGLVRFENVEYGDYTIIEVSAPSGFYRSKETISVSVRDEGATYQLGNFENQAMPLEIVEGTIEINKSNEFGQPLSGAKFALYNVMGNVVEEAVTNSSGIARFVSVPEGVYTVKEVVAPEKYVLSDQVEEVTIASGQNNYVKLTFINERSSDAPWPGVTVEKVDDAGKPLAGVKFALYKATDTAFTAPVANSTTNANGIATFANVVPGQYVVKEIEALKGYILSTVTLPVTVTDDAKTYHAGTVENRIIRGDIVVNKVNELNEPLQGAEFGLYDQSGKLVTTAVSNSNGVASFKDIAYGVYSLKELTAPSTYSKSNEVISITITEDGKVQTFTVVNIKVIVSGESGGSPGTGSNQSGGNNAGTGSNNGNNNVDFGTGSNQSGSNNGTTDGKGNTVGVNQSNELPKTGDNISAMLWLFAASGLLILTLLVVGRKRTQKQ